MNNNNNNGRVSVWICGCMSAQQKTSKKNGKEQLFMVFSEPFENCWFFRLFLFAATIVWLLYN